MYKLMNFEELVILGDSPYGSGRSEKYWVESKNGEIKGIFKYPKITSFNTLTGEFWAEKLASEIGKLLEIDVAEVDMGIYKGRTGSMSYFIPKEKEILLEAVHMIATKFPDYNHETLFDNKRNAYYSIPMLHEAMGSFSFFTEFLKAMIFDALIGNTDRHHSNWGILVDTDYKTRFCPLYDNGSSLCCYEEKNIDLIIQDGMKFLALVDSKSKSILKKDNGKRMTHSEVVKVLYENYYSETIGFVEKIEEKLTDKEIDRILNNFSDSIISVPMKKLLHMFICWKRDMIIRVYKSEV